MIGELKLASIKSHHLYLEYAKVTSSSRVQILLKTLMGFIHRIYRYPQVSYFKRSIINVSYWLPKFRKEGLNEAIESKEGNVFQGSM